MEVWKEWDNFKTVVSSKVLAIQHEELEKEYRIFAVEGAAVYRINIPKTSPANTDQTDFETNYKSNSNLSIHPQTADGVPKILSAITSLEVSMFVTGEKKSITGSDDELDSDFTEEIKLQGVRVYVRGGEDGDTMDFEVGYDAPAWTVVKVFGNSIPVLEETGWREYSFQNNAVSTISTTVKCKLRYNQIDTATTKQVVVHYICHK